MIEGLAFDQAAMLDARMRVARSVSQQQHVAERLRQLRHDAENILGPDHPVTLETAAAAAWAGAGAGSARAVVAEYEQLLEKLAGRIATPPYWAPEGARSGYARALRRAGDERALAYYKMLADERTAEAPESRQASIARLNLSVALRDCEDRRRAQHGQLLVDDEVRNRTKRWGHDDRFTLIARGESVQAELLLQRLGATPRRTASDLYVEARTIVELRNKLLGPLHEATLKSRITLAETMAAAGEPDRALWLMTQVRAASLHVPIDTPWRIPRVIAECCLLTGDEADLRDGLRYAEQALELAQRALGPEAGQSARCRETLRALTDRLAV